MNQDVDDQEISQKKRSLGLKEEYPKSLKRKISKSFKRK